MNMRNNAQVYYMSYSGQVRKYAKKLEEKGVVTEEITEANPFIKAEKPYLLVVPSYEDEEVYDHVIDFLETGDNADKCKGVLGSGNLNFKAFGLYGITAKRLSEEFGFPVLKLFEFQGSRRDVESLLEYLEEYNIK